MRKKKIKFKSQREREIEKKEAQQDFIIFIICNFSLLHFLTSCDHASASYKIISIVNCNLHNYKLFSCISNTIRSANDWLFFQFSFS